MLAPPIRPFPPALTTTPGRKPSWRPTPGTGIGPGAYVWTNAVEILDNEYLATATTMGLPRRRWFRHVCRIADAQQYPGGGPSARRGPEASAGAVAAAAGVAALASGTFDSLSFPVFVIVLSAVVGLSAATWQVAQQQKPQ